MADIQHEEPPVDFALLKQRVLAEGFSVDNYLVTISPAKVWPQQI
jgi:hypothetical protein